MMGVANDAMLEWFTPQDANKLRSVSKVVKSDVEDRFFYDDEVTVIKDVAKWRTCFRLAKTASLSKKEYNYQNSTAREEDLVHLRGVTTVYMRGCRLITDKGLSNLVGIHTLDMSDCPLITDKGLDHLKGIHTLYMRGCPLITDKGLERLKGINTLDMVNCPLITDKGLAHLKGIHDLTMEGRPLITDKGLEHLKGINTLSILRCSLSPLITDKGLEHLKGIYDLSMSFCKPPSITGESFGYLAGVKKLLFTCCEKSVVSNARQLLPGTEIQSKMEQPEQDSDEESEDEDEDELDEGFPW